MVRAYGSEVVCEFRTSRPLLPGWKPAGLRLRYCLLLRRLELFADLNGRDEWKLVNPERPIILDLAIPGIPSADLAKDKVAATLAAFNRIPADNRAEAEQIRTQFGDGTRDLLIPGNLRGFAADEGRLYVVDGNEGLYFREPGGNWRFGGVCPGWWLTAHRGRLYCHRGMDILTRKSDDRDAPWERWGDFPTMRPDERSGFLAIAGDRLFAMIHPNVLCSKSLASPAAPWHREPQSNPVWPDGFAGAGKMLYSHNDRNALSRPSVDQSAEWKTIGTWPKDCGFLAVDGDRILVCGGPGPIYSRPITAGPEVEWSVAGRVQEPPRK